MTLLLAQEEVDDDRHLTRGARVRDLAQSLKALHQKDFGDLLGADEVRYDVVGTDSLEPGEVQVRFGHAVYLPSAGESTLYQVSTSSDGHAWQSACPIYLNQRLALIGQDSAPAWPFAAAGAILLVNDGPDTPIEVQVRPKGAFECVYDAATLCYTVSRRDMAQQLWLKIERVARAPAAVWKARAPAPEAELTALPVCAHPAGAGVTLVALALPRLSRYRDTGASSLDIGLDHALGITPEGGTSAISFSVDQDDLLHVRTGAAREAVSAPAVFHPAGAGQVELAAVAPGMAERYCALLVLPQPPSAPLVKGARLVFGRSAPVLAALRVLDSPRFVQCPDGASADRIGLSRNAFSFEASAGGYQIVRQSATQALFHLDAQRRFIAAIGEASAQQPYLLPHGHHLVAGHYVLRFDA